MTDEISSHNSSRRVYRTRYSVLLVLVLLVPMILMFRGILHSPEPALIISFSVFLLIIVMLAGINYVIDNTELIFRIWTIRSGKVDIRSIKKIERSYFVLASNAASLKRLLGRMKRGSQIPMFLISPKDEEIFLENLREVNPAIEISVENSSGFFHFWDWDF